MITKVLFSECGLIVSCFTGHIELFDTVDFVSKGKWDNNTEMTQGKKQKAVIDNKGPKVGNFADMADQSNSFN